MSIAKVVVVAIAATILGVAPFAYATTINDPWAPNTSDPTEINLYEIYNNLYGTSLSAGSSLPQVSPDEIFNLLGSAASIEAEALYSAYGQQFGFYQPTDGSGPITYTQIFDIQSPNYGSPLPGFISPLSVTGDFGFYDLAGNVYWHSQPGLNPNGEDHMVTLSTADPNVFLLAFEDLPFALSDRDYNDLVVQITVRQRNIVPEPTSMALLGLGLAGMVVRRMRAVAK